VDDNYWGAALDIGRYEAGYRLEAEPAAQRIEAGGTAQYTLSLFPADIPFTADLSVINPPSNLTVTLSTTTLAPSEPVTLTVTHDGSAGTQVYTLDITSTGGGFTRTVKVELLVGGIRVYLPVIRK
jgi:hypothetical protein